MPYVTLREEKGEQLPKQRRGKVGREEVREGGRDGRGREREKKSCVERAACQELGLWVRNHGRDGTRGIIYFHPILHSSCSLGTHCFHCCNQTRKPESQGAR